LYRIEGDDVLVQRVVRSRWVKANNTDALLVQRPFAQEA